MSYVIVEGVKLAYRDEGHGPVVVFVHGTPSSSAEFAGVFARLRTSFRCVAIDHLGFGESDKPAAADYSIGAHRARLQAVLARLGVGDYHLVAHDFGGPIALPLAAEHPERLLSLTLINTWCWPLEETEPALRWQRPLLRSAFMRFLYRHLNFSARVLVKAAWGTYRPLTRAQHARYQDAFQTAAEREGTVAFLQALVDGHESASWSTDRIAQLATVPVLLLWGSGDRLVTTKTLQRWRDMFPGARVVALGGVGHFVADEAPELVADALLRFWREASAAAAEAS